MINGKLIGLGVSIMSVIMTGCASTSQPVSYDESHSRAYNIAQAGGLYDVSDKYVPRENYESLQFAGSAATNSLLFTSSFGANLDLTSGLGLGLVTSFLEQPDTASRNSVIAWMPKSEASSTKNAQEKLLSEMKTAIESTLEEMGLEYEATNGNSERKVEFYFHSEEYGCPIYKPGMTNVDLCYIATEVFEPREAKAPSFVGVDEIDSYAFESNHSVYYNRFRVTPGKGSHVPSDKIYSLVSGKLPSWAYVYVASGNIQVGESKFKTPYLLDNSEPLLFIHPEN